VTLRSESIPRASSVTTAQMFDRVAATYSLLNHVLSFGRDFSWRRQLAEAIPPQPGMRVLDLATGTGELLLEIAHRHPQAAQLLGLDISENMLAICQKRIRQHNLGSRVRAMLGDATDTGLEAESFEVVTCAFGVRNVRNPSRMLGEVYRLLRPGGTTLILEFSLPPARLLRAVYLLYLRGLVPLIGGLLCGDRAAYRYLNKTIEVFYKPDEFCGLIRRAGLVGATARPLTFGVVQLYQAVKPQ